QVLDYALQGLSQQARQVLQIVAAFHAPTHYDTLLNLLVKKPTGPVQALLDFFSGRAHLICTSDEHELDDILAELEDRGLLGWDKHANRYDLHPIVRGIVWNTLSDAMQRKVYRGLRAYFAALPKIKPDQVQKLEDLAPVIELYNTLIGLSQYGKALNLFERRL